MRDLTKSHWMKTCPRCSQKAGHLVWMPYPEAFGETEKRPKSGAQSWCSRCRAKKEKKQ